MKNLLYYQDAMKQEFTANVLKTGVEDGRSYIVLDNTAFYPTGGGQPHDTGWINEIEIIDVEKIDEGIRHYTHADVSIISGEITGKLNWARRFDHMQQHTGQHILTAAFVELYDIPTTSFHLGEGLVTIDLNVTAITEEQLEAVENRVNAIILENRPIETKWVTKEELSQYNLRKDVKVDEDIRLVIIPDYDYNGCGGTHPTATGQVGMLKILATEKMKQQIRIHFVCGNRVRTQLAMRKQVLTDVARQLSAPEENAAEALRKFVQATKVTEKNLTEAQDALLEYEAKDLAKQQIAAAHFENRSIQQLQKLARFITLENPNAVALLVAENLDKIQFVAARGSEQTRSMKDISAAALPLINGKGGGNDALVQGGGEKVTTPEALLDVMKAVLR
ncbi:alanyl-tRNA editing protein [Lysinibacillus sp. 2017]|uniref:alanyl-tRNA editing protein n=1 Tax=unclassified Lysinibacillus TaxID=2636778 RepID=UPI000D5261E1|nr:MULTISPECIES: DHHA1 domain-containing protein [unclassified Lysinibacillus]AWE06014.1 alanyl-tRNA editing protein [Lysinibacillus sp. 2017]TGN34797.1 alanyl-tRNA editing protein [Lysinibacillus sp. S2017]